MKHRRSDKTSLVVSGIGFGAEWMERPRADGCVGRCLFGVRITERMIKVTELMCEIGTEVRETLKLIPGSLA